jgi:hypothetical protein
VVKGVHWGPRQGTSVRRGWRGLPGCSSWFPGAEVDGSRDGSWRCRCAELYLAAKPFHVRVNVDKLAYPLHRPTTCDRQMKGQSSLSDTAMSHRVVVGGDAFPGGVKPLSLDI